MERIDSFKDPAIDRLRKEEDDLVGSKIGTYERPRNILDAVSEIQRFYTIEKKTALPVEYFTVIQVLDFFKIGFKNGLLESIICTFVVAILQHFYPEIKHYFNPDSTTFADVYLLKIISFFPVFVTAFLLLYLSKYYTADFTKRAIYSLLNGRSTSFLLKGLIIYFVLFLLDDYSRTNPQSIKNILFFLNETIIPIFVNVLNKDLENLYFNAILPTLMSIAKEIALVMFLAAILPYLTLYLKSFRQRVRKIRMQKIIDDI